MFRWPLDSTGFWPPGVCFDETGAGSADPAGDKGEPSHKAEGPPPDRAQFADVADPLAAASGIVADQLNKDDPQAEGDKPPAKDPLDQVPGGDAHVNDETLEGLVDSNGFAPADEGFDPDNLDIDGYGKWLAVQSEEQQNSELDRLVAASEADATATDGGDPTKPPAKEAEHYTKMAKAFRDADKPSGEKPQAEGDLPPKSASSGIEKHTPLTMQDLSKSLGLEYKDFQELPEEVRNGLKAALDTERAKAVDAVNEAKATTLKLTEAEEKAKHTQKEAKQAFAQRDSFKKQAQARQLETFRAAAEHVGIPEDLIDVAYNEAKFVDKNRKAIPLRNVFNALKQSKPSLFRETEAPKPKPGASGSPAGGSPPPGSSSAPKAPVDYRKSVDPLAAAAAGVAEELKILDAK